MRLAIISASIALVCVLQPANAQWQPRGNGDCGGMDVGCSVGSTPANNRCFPGAVARTAVCWDNRTGGDPPNFRANNCSASGRWCTYKSVAADQCAGGGAPSAKYECTPAPQQPIQGAEVGVYHIDVVREPKGVADTVADCLRDNVCSTVLSVAASQVGIPPNAMRFARTAVVVSDALQNPTSEETHSSIKPPPGLRVCRVNIRTLSVVPAAGDRASVFSLTATSPEIAIYTWTPIQSLGQGRAWYDGYVTVTFVPVNTPAERCSVTDTRYNYGCRGGQGVNQGLPACSTVDM